MRFHTAWCPCNPTKQGQARCMMSHSAEMLLCFYQWTRTCRMRLAARVLEGFKIPHAPSVLDSPFNFDLHLHSAHIKCMHMLAEAAARLSTLKFWFYRWQNIQNHSRSPAVLFFFCGLPSPPASPPSPNKQRSHKSASILFQKTWTGKLWTGFALKRTGIILL